MPPGNDPVRTPRAGGMEKMQQKLLELEADLKVTLQAFKELEEFLGENFVAEGTHCGIKFD